MITARCDFEHGKVPMFNYLPVVRLEDWANREGGDLLRARARASKFGELRGLLKQAEFSPAILDSEDRHDILERLFPKDDESRKGKRWRTKAADIIAKLDLIDVEALADPTSHSQIREGFPTILKALIAELTSHRLHGYHFLPSVEPTDGTHEGFVVLLRQIIHLPFKLAEKISRGLIEEDLEQLSADIPTARIAIDFATCDFCEPVGVVRSPDLEHLMQSFALLFTRIGIEDLDQQYAEALSLRLLTQDGAS